jgi:hypothetical protein
VERFAGRIIYGRLSFSSRSPLVSDGLRVIDAVAMPWRRNERYRKGILGLLLADDMAAEIPIAAVAPHSLPSICRYSPKKL